MVATKVKKASKQADGLLTTINIQGIELPMRIGGNGEVPDLGEFLEEALDHRNLKKIVAGVKKNYPILLIGPTGCGKTATIKWLAGKTGNGYRRIQLNGSTDIDNFIGHYTLNSEGTVWVDGILTDAMKKGHWLLLDEINMALPEILVIINSITDDDRSLILDEKGTEVVKPHENFRLFAAMNPTQDYTGTKELNTATRNRFVEVIYDYPTMDCEIDIISKHTGIEKDLGGKKDVENSVLRRMVKFAHVIRDKIKSEETVMAVCSTRQLIQWADLSEVIPIKNAAHMSIIDKVDDAEESKMLRDELDKFFRNKDTLDRYRKEDAKFLKAQAEALAQAEAQAEAKTEDMPVAEPSTATLPNGIEVGISDMDAAIKAIEQVKDALNFNTTVDPSGDLINSVPL